MRLLKTIARWIVGLYAVLFVGLYLAQDKLLYNIEPERVAPEAAGLASVREVVMTAPDGAKLVAWHAAAVAGQPTLLYFHGQGGSLKARATRIQRFMSEGWGVFMMTWRGYGGSTGAPSEKNNVADAHLAYDTLRNAGVEPRDVFLYGESLGTGVAVQLATGRDAAGLILDAPYTSTVDVAADRYPAFPVRLAMRDTYLSDRFISKVRMPVLVLHGEKDAVIPVRYGERLFAAANEPKQFALFPRGHHSDLYLHGALDIVRDFLTRQRHP